MLFEGERSSYLLDEERVVRELRRHPAVLVRPSAETLGGVILAGIVGRALGATILGYLLWGLVIFLYLRLFYRIGSWLVERIFLTDRRLFLTSGLATRRVAAIPVSKLTDVTFERSPLGRILGYGKLIVESAGQNQAVETITYIPTPEDFYQAVSSVVFGSRHRG
jgi:uncharacterized membrane protein YdbT with pleckstrin-like domain